MAPLHLLLGPEIGEKKTHIEKLRASLAKELGTEPEEERYYCQDCKPGALVSQLLNGSLFSSHRLVQYIGVEQLSGKTEIAPLLDYAKHPSPEISLIMLSDEVGVEKALKEAVGEKNCTVFWEMFEDRKEEWLRSFFRKEGMRISEKAVDAILDLVENNTDALRRECSRLALFLPKDKEIDEETVESYLSHNRQEDAFSLFDRLACGELREALESLEKMLFSKEGEPIGILAGLLWSFKRLETWLILQNDGLRPDEAFLRSGIKSKKLQGLYKEAARRYPLPACRRVLSRITEADYSLRSGGAVTEKIIMQKLIYETVVKAGQRIQTWEDFKN